MCLPPYDVDRVSYFRTYLHDLLFFLLDLIPRNTSSQRKDTMKLDFESMRIEKRYNRIDIRRLSSESSVKQQDTDCLATQWLWFRKEESGDWVKYGAEVRRICFSKLGRTRGGCQLRLKLRSLWTSSLVGYIGRKEDRRLGPRSSPVHARFAPRKASQLVIIYFLLSMNCPIDSLQAFSSTKPPFFFLWSQKGTRHRKKRRPSGRENSG